MDEDRAAGPLAARHRAEHVLLERRSRIIAAHSACCGRRACRAMRDPARHRRERPTGARRNLIELTRGPNDLTAMNTILTRLSAELIEKYEAEGFWQGDTIYSLVRWHAEHTPAGVRGARPVPPADLSRSCWPRRMRSPPISPAMASAPGQRVGVWLPSRIESVVALLACSKSGAICSPSLHRDHTIGEVVELMQRTRCVAFIWQNGYGADADKRDVDRSAQGGADAAARLSAEAAGRDRQGAVCRACAGSERRLRAVQDRPQPDRLSGVHLRHHRQAQGRDALRQHAARQRAPAREGLEHRQYLGGLYALAAQPQSRLRRAGDGAGDGRRTRHQRSAARREPRRPHSRNRHELPGRRAAERHRSPGRDAEAQAEGPRPADRLPHLRLRGAERGGRGADRPGHQAAERLRHDRELLATSTPCRTTRRG